MSDICLKCGSPRILLFTSYACNCPKEGSPTFKVGQVLTTRHNINQALREGYTLKSASGASVFFYRFRTYMEMWSVTKWILESIRPRPPEMVIWELTRFTWTVMGRDYEPES